MNRLAVVLAADSATTVTSWVDNKQEERYFKGANKVHQLSNTKPVGMMIFDSADILKVPWEVVIKDFRKDFGTKSYDSVGEYAQAFFDFLSSNVKMFPSQVQKDYIVSAARGSVLQFVFGTKPPAGTGDPVEFYNQAVADRLAVLQASSMHKAFDHNFAEEVRKQVLEDIEKECSSYNTLLAPDFPSDGKAMAELGLMEIFHNPARFLSTTGMVFAGFGDNDIFPA